MEERPRAWGTSVLLVELIELLIEDVELPVVGTSGVSRRFLRLLDKCNVADVDDEPLLVSCSFSSLSVDDMVPNETNYQLYIRSSLFVEIVCWLLCDSLSIVDDSQERHNNGAYTKSQWMRLETIQ